MRIERVHTYEQLEEYLKGWSNFCDDPPYDFNGAFHLFLAILSNLAKNFNDGDLGVLEECAPNLTQAQKNFLEVLLRIG